MNEASGSREITTKVLREGEPEPHDDWSSFTPEERIEAVWTLTKACLAWNNQVSDESRLQRTVTHIQRARG